MIDDLRFTILDCVIYDFRLCECSKNPKSRNQEIKNMIDDLRFTILDCVIYDFRLCDCRF